jgi:FdhD protein
MSSGAVDTAWYEYRDQLRRTEGMVVAEIFLTIYVNGTEFANIMSTPRDQGALALGFLRNEGFIREHEEVEIITISQNGCCVDVWLDRHIDKPERVVITSGCGGGVTFDDPSLGITPLQDSLRMAPQRLFKLIAQLQRPDSLYARARGVHAAGLSDGMQVFLTAEDVGRHNTIDKLAGMCLLRGFDSEGKILLATGRVSSEMLRKGALMGCPIIASRNSPTSMSIAMARAWNITLVGYVRQKTMRVYSCPERLGFEGTERLPIIVG